MGARNADSSGRLHRPPVEEVMTVSALADHLTKLSESAAEPHYKSALADAADAIRILTKHPRSAKASLKNESFQGFKYSIDLNDEDKALRLALWRDKACTDLVGYMILSDTDEIYDFGGRIMRCYDQLEGLLDKSK